MAVTQKLLNHIPTVFRIVCKRSILKMVHDLRKNCKRRVSSLPNFRASHQTSDWSTYNNGVSLELSSRMSQHNTEIVGKMSSSIRIFSFIIVVSLVILHECEGLNKYSAAANKQSIKKAKSESIIGLPTSLRELDKPYRMAKLNLLWSKAKHVSDN